MTNCTLCKDKLTKRALNISNENKVNSKISLDPVKTS